MELKKISLLILATGLFVGIVNDSWIIGIITTLLFFYFLFKD